MIRALSRAPCAVHASACSLGRLSKMTLRLFCVHERSTSVLFVLRPAPSVPIRGIAARAQASALCSLVTNARGKKTKGQSQTRSCVLDVGAHSRKSLQSDRRDGFNQAWRRLIPCYNIVSFIQCPCHSCTQGKRSAGERERAWCRRALNASMNNVEGLMTGRTECARRRQESGRIIDHF